MTNVDTSWWPQNYYIQPHYSTMPERLRVEDIFVQSLSRVSQLKFWRTARNAACNAWASGLAIEIDVRERQTGYRDERITLGVDELPAGIGGWTGFEVDPAGTHDPFPPGEEHPGMCWIHVAQDEWRTAWLAKSTKQLKDIITHELGHAFGFGHGGSGVMAVPRVAGTPNYEELTLCKEYWGIEEV